MKFSFGGILTLIMTLKSVSMHIWNFFLIHYKAENWQIISSIDAQRRANNASHGLDEQVSDNSTTVLIFEMGI